MTDWEREARAVVGGGGKEGAEPKAWTPRSEESKWDWTVTGSSGWLCCKEGVWANSSWSTRSSGIKQWWKVLSGVRLKCSLLQHEKEADRPNWTNIKLFYLAFLSLFLLTTVY